VSDVKPTVLILCGGLATRLGALAEEMPKVLLPVGGRPFIEILLDQVRRAGLTDVVLATGHLHEQVVDAVGDGGRLGLRVRYSREEHPLGTGGAVAAALGMLGEVFLVMNGDSYCACDLAVLAAQAAHAPVMVLTEVPSRGRYGTVEVADGRVTGFREKGAASAGLINAGIYLLRRADFAAVTPGETVSLERDLFPTWVPDITAMVSEGCFVDIGTPESYASVKEGLGDAGE